MLLEDLQAVFQTKLSPKPLKWMNPKSFAGGGIKLCHSTFELKPQILCMRQYKALPQYVWAQTSAQSSATVVRLYVWALPPVSEHMAFESKDALPPNLSNKNLFRPAFISRHCCIQSPQCNVIILIQKETWCMQRCVAEEKRWVIGVDRWNFMASRGDREGRGALGAVNGQGDIPGLSSISFTRCLCPHGSLFLENSLNTKTSKILIF